MRSLFVCAGDLSGDIHASRLVKELQSQLPDLHIWGVGGPRMVEAGAEVLYNSQDFAVIGVANILGKLPKFAKMRADLLAQVRQRQPVGILLVDFGGFNLNLAASLKKLVPNIPIIYFISPQVWGSRPWRIKVIAATVSKMLTIFPFEETLYRSKGVSATFVGHPLTESYAAVDKNELRKEFSKKHGLDPTRSIVGIFPGSRITEVRAFLPTILQAMSWLASERNNLQFVMSVANQKIAGILYEVIDKNKKLHFINSILKLVPSDDNNGLMAASDLLWTKSGTTTLEGVFMETPMIVFYRGDWISFVLFQIFKTVKFISWPNLLAGKMLVPELIQLDCRAELLVKYTSDWLDVPGARQEISEELRRIKSYLRKGDFVANAATELKSALNLS